ncbi:hypothetical protein NLM33_27505 [Bradyrhizobium sp. CCGUVB1N3]|uniref:hypothetical protein n=1 Tax=Bradyrhizobium sp. CCGUVB1N3 TaxID=2949629 RepID=UPI0020B2F87B|nr:hypothetical protein [Bradyrhizobium sp. CCGUVB1N3]MCP3474064.1 hypothetical protein [Bradyrhizobium sp. CCGUVB1N3]
MMRRTQVHSHSASAANFHLWLRGKDADRCYAIVGQQMSHAVDEIFRTFSEVQHEIQRSAQYQNATQGPMPIGPKTTLTGSDSGALGNANAFLKHLQSLLRDPNTLYHTYTRYTQASPGLWGTF